MKTLRTALSLLLTICLILPVLSSCTGTGALSQIDRLDRVILEYNLSDTDIAEFEAKAEAAREALSSVKSAQEAEEAMSQVYAYYTRIEQQSRIAEILYYCHQNDETAKNNYLSSTAAAEKASTVINELEMGLFLQNPDIREEYFEGMTEEELEEAFILSESIGQHGILLSEIVSDFHSNPEYSEETRYQLYNRLIAEGTAFAKQTGYDNYYDYTAENSYFRDYGTEELEKFRDFVARYVVPLDKRATETYTEIYENLSDAQFSRLSDLMGYTPFNKLEKNYLNEYLDNLPESPSTGMKHMFEKNNYICADWSDSHAGAFTTVVNAPFCYFGPGEYQGLFVVAHELGHYYADLTWGIDNYSYDLAETHSQGNELLLLRYMKGSLDEEVYQALVAFKINSLTQSIIIGTVLDHFEQTIYTDLSSANYKKEDFERILKEKIFPKYSLSTEMEELLLSNWEEVCITTPGYYISYATSAVAALSLYEMAVEDYEAATEAYRKTVEEPDAEQMFLGTLKNAGIASPFEETSFAAIGELIR